VPTVSIAATASPSSKLGTAESMCLRLRSKREGTCRRLISFSCPLTVSAQRFWNRHKSLGGSASAQRNEAARVRLILGSLGKGNRTGFFAGFGWTFPKEDGEQCKAPGNPQRVVRVGR
jgi:hypothetical protein